LGDDVAEMDRRWEWKDDDLVHRFRLVRDFEASSTTLVDVFPSMGKSDSAQGGWKEIPYGELNEREGFELRKWWWFNESSEPLSGDLKFDLLERQSFLDFEPKLAQRGTPVTGKKDLEGDGSNLALVLNHILRDEQRKEKFLRLARDVLDFIDGIDVDRFADNQLLTHLEEGFGNGSRPIPASMASDGTLSILALIVALYFDDSDVAFIEEPTRNVHPHLAGRIAQMVRDAGRNKQVFATTHNPQFLAGFELDEILLVKRDKEGVSRIERASEDETLKAFLKNDVGIDQVFIQNILGQ
jgi:hypothetical protein